MMSKSLRTLPPSKRRKAINNSMKLKRSWCLVFLSFLVLSTLQSQDLLERKAFFEKQRAVYQEWLDHSGVGKVFKVEDLLVKPDRVDLYLSLPTQRTSQKRADETGYFFTNYRNVRKKYNEQNTLDLEQQLFLKMLHIMELEPSQATVQLYDTYDMTKASIGFYAVYYEESQIKVDSSGYRGTDHSVPVYIAIEESAEAGVQLTKLSQPATVFACIENFFRERVAHKNSQDDCQIDSGEITAFPISETQYQIGLKPLCKEVLKNQNNPAICDWLQRLGFNCSTIKREWLTFTFTLTPQNKGFQLDCYLDGKCKAPEVFAGTQYKVIDHDEQSTEILQTYGDELLQSLRSYLAKGCQ